MVKIGNEFRGSQSGVNVADVAFMVGNKIGVTGVVFAFSAYFRSDKPIQFQIWRPLSSSRGGSTNKFQLLQQVRTIPSVIDAREDVSSFSSVHRIL